MSAPGSRLGAVSALALFGLSACGGASSAAAPDEAPPAEASRDFLAPPFFEGPGASPRAPAVSSSFSPGAVPTIDVSPPSRFDTSDAVTRELDVEDLGGGSRRVTLRRRGDRTVGVVQQGANVGEQVVVDCEGRPPSPLEWSTLTLLPDGRALYTVSVGMIDSSCRVHETRTRSVDALPLVSGIAFGVRRCEETCDPATPLTVLTPRLVEGSADELGRALTVRGGRLTTVELPMRRGSASTFEATVDVGALTALLGARPPWLPPGASAVSVGVDVSQSAAEPFPVGVAYYVGPTAAAEPPPPGDHVIDF